MSTSSNIHWEAEKQKFIHLAEEWDNAKKATRGKPKAFKNPHQLWCAACDYFKKSDSTPIKKYEVVKSGPEVGKILCTPTARPYSWSGFQAYLWQNKIIRQLDFYRANRNGEYDDYQEVLGAIGDIMFAQKFEYAAIGVFKENIIIRDLQMREEKSAEEEESSSTVTPIVNVYTSAPPLAESEDEINLNRLNIKSNENTDENSNP